MRRILSIVFWIVILAGVTSLFIFSNHKQDEVVCPKFEIDVDYGNAPVLVTQGNIRQQITDNKIKVRGKALGQIEVEKIQKLFDNDPFIKKAAISIGVNGIVKASIKQRNPLVRVIDQKGQQFYIDEEGYLMPLSPDFPARLIIASGNISPIGKIRKKGKNEENITPYKKLPVDLQKIYITALSLRNDIFNNALIEQIFMNESKEIELIPKVGRQSIILGDTTFLSEKLKNLKIFYTDGMKNTGWDTYKSINLKFRNQVVCLKSE
ncbi:MAG: hypothetical protein HGA37_00365 [Lentimicrobium sp.]|nr:hypothetical protein [Lentimicrobium sp.]